MATLGDGTVVAFSAAVTFGMTPSHGGGVNRIQQVGLPRRLTRAMLELRRILDRGPASLGSYLEGCGRN